MVLDLIIVITIGIFIWRGWQSGLLKSLAGFVIVLVSMLGAFLTVRPVSKWVIAQGWFSSRVEELTTAMEQMLDKGGNFLVEMMTKLYLPESWARKLIGASEVGTATEKLAQDSATTLSALAISALVFILLLAIYILILKLVTNAMTKLLEEVPLVGFINRVGGVAINTVFAAVVVVVGLFLLSSLSSWYPKLGSWQEGSIIASFVREKGFFIDLWDAIF